MVAATKTRENESKVWTGSAHAQLQLHIKAKGSTS